MKRYYYRYYIAVLVLFVIFYSGILLAPYFAHLGDSSKFWRSVSTFLYAIYSPICHQMPQRSFFIFSHKMAVCARCFGIYSGFLFGMLIFPIYAYFKKFYNLEDFNVPSKWYLIFASMPMIIDGTTQLFGFRESFNILRFITGFIVGFTIVFYILPILFIILSNYRKRKKGVKYF